MKEQDVTNTGSSILLKDYAAENLKTDTLPDSLTPLLYGVYGEVGGVMTAVKKKIRENKAFITYEDEVEEELGDLLWYFTGLCRRLDFDISDIFGDVINGKKYSKAISTSSLVRGPLSTVSYKHKLPDLDEMLFDLGKASSSLFILNNTDKDAKKLLGIFADLYLQTVQAANVCFTKVVQRNIDKTKGRFIKTDIKLLPTFDSEFSEDERLPNTFEISITQRKNGRSYLQWNKVFIGDPLTDNIRDPDGYRFHDVFHFSFAAILHWSPVFRALIKQKRKSNPAIDEAQDGGRAIVVEEGLSAWIFSQAKALNYFENSEKVSFDLLKSVQHFVRGYEVETCPLHLWERAILDGYKVFKQVKDNNGGIIVGDRIERTISYKP